MSQHPNEKAYFGKFGGQFVPETAMFALIELEKAYEKAKKDPVFQKELTYLLKNYVGRETPLYYAKNLSEYYHHDIYLKREDLNHTGAHKINNALGQVLLAKRMGKKKVIAETGAGQHGVATATAAALLGLECEVYMGAVDIERQKLNVFRMELLGARDDPTTKLYGVEAGGYGIDTDMHAATLSLGKEGIIHGMKTYVLQNQYGQISPVHSISAGLDYPGVGPEHAYLFEIKKATYAPITDKEAIDALLLITRKEGIIPAIESAHALAYLEKLCPTLSKDKPATIIVNVSGRGDKDMHTVFSILKGEKYE